MEKTKRIKHPPIVFDVEEVSSTIRVRIYSIDPRLIDSLGSDGFAHNCGGVIESEGFSVDLSDSRNLSIELTDSQLSISARRGEIFEFPVECYLTQPKWIAMLRMEGDSISVILDAGKRNALALRIRASLSNFNVVYRYPRLALPDDEWDG